LNIDLMAGHMFLLYFAVMSAITPPVAVAAYAASAIADENPLKIAVGAVRLALAAFLVPFTFVFNQALLMDGSIVEIVLATLSVAAGLVLIVVALEGYFRQALGRFARHCLGIAGILMLFVSPILAGAAVALTGTAIAWQRLMPRHSDRRSQSKP
jgi:TRAP-type uncharacterized transport system fused permease subunit